MVGVDGRRRRRNFRGATQQEALGKLRRARAEMERAGGTLVDGATTLGEWIERWLDTTIASGVEQGRLKPATAASYRQLTKDYVAPEIGAIRLERLTAGDIDAMTSHMTQAGYSANTRRLARTLVRAALKAAVAEGLVGRNVAEHSVAPRLAREQREGLALDDARRLQASLDGEPIGPLVEVALWTGLRRGELLALRWSDVDQQAQVLHVGRTLGRIVGQGLVEGTTKTEDATADVPLVPSAVAALKRQRAMQAAERLRLGHRWRDTEHVFHGPLGGPLDPARATRSWTELRTRLELPAVTFHDLRHTTATLLREAGVSIDVISRILRHSSIVVTADIYTRIGTELQAAALQTLERHVLGGAGAPPS